MLTQYTSSVLPQVELNERVQCEFSFINTEKFNFSFQAELSGPRSALQYLEFSPTNGSVDVGQSARLPVFPAIKEMCLEGSGTQNQGEAFNIV